MVHVAVPVPCLQYKFIIFDDPDLYRQVLCDVEPAAAAATEPPGEAA
jgi:hypothetical protein